MKYKPEDEQHKKNPEAKDLFKCCSSYEINLKSERGQKPTAVGILNMLINNGSKWRFITVENRERDSKSALVRKRARERYEFLFKMYSCAL